MVNVKKMVPYEVIEAAVSQEVEAMNYIIRHFEAYLNQLSQKTLFDERKNAYTYIDPEIKRRLELKLMMAILGFEIRER